MAPSTAASASGGAGATNSATQALYQKAKAEGQVVWEGPQTEDQMAQVIQAFEKTYPGVKIAYTDVKPAQIMTNVKVQQAAHHVSIDVGQVAELEVTETLSGTLPMKVDWASLGVPQDRIYQNVLVKYGSIPGVVIYNTQKVSASDAPKTWNDLLDPRWQGKMAIDGRATFMPAFFADPQLGAAKGLEFATKLAAQKPSFEASLSTVHAKVISGQALVGTDALSSFLSDKAKNAPIEIAPVSPIHAATAFAEVPDGAPHPAAAQLLASWMGADVGQAALDKAGASLLGSCSAGKQNEATQALCSRHITWTQLKTPDQFAQNLDYLKQVQKSFGTFSGK